MAPLQLPPHRIGRIAEMKFLLIFNYIIIFQSCFMCHNFLLHICHFIILFCQKMSMKHLLINLTFLIYPEYLLKYFCTKKPAHFRTGLLHLCIFLINNDRISTINRIIDQCCLICRKVDTAMTSGATFISVSPKEDCQDAS